MPRIRLRAVGLDGAAVEFSGPGSPLSDQGFGQACGSIGIGPAELWTVLQVETSGCGYLVDRRPTILFERHVFSRLTGRRFDATHAGISAPSPGRYGRGGAHQYDRLQAALLLDPDAALLSTSWGLGQIMGENHRAAGFPDVRSMVAATVASEDAQLRALATFLDSTQLAGPLRAHDWASFARGYNGPRYAGHGYHARLESCFGRYASGPLPDLRVRAVQMYLGYRGYFVGGIDGVLGSRTSRAIGEFRRKAGLPRSSEIDAPLLSALMQPNAA